MSKRQALLNIMLELCQDNLSEGQYLDASKILKELNDKAPDEETPIECHLFGFPDRDGDQIEHWYKFSKLNHTCNGNITVKTDEEETHIIHIRNLKDNLITIFKMKMVYSMTIKYGMINEMIIFDEYIKMMEHYEDEHLKNEMYDCYISYILNILVGLIL